MRYGWELQWAGQDAESCSARSWTLQLVRLLQVNSEVIIGNNTDWRINISIQQCVRRIFEFDDESKEQRNIDDQNVDKCIADTLWVQATT